MAQRGASARRYAEAVFDIAVESNTLDAWGNDLRTIADFAAESDVAGLLNNTKVPGSEKVRLLSAAVGSHISPLAMNLVKVLAERGKLGILRGVQVAFQEKADDRRGVAHAVVTTAVPLSDDERGAIEARLSTVTGKRVDVTPVVDESIIGGVVARIGDQLIDGSTRTRLVALKRRLSEAR